MVKKITVKMCGKPNYPIETTRNVHEKYTPLGSWQEPDDSITVRREDGSLINLIMPK